MSQVGRFSNGTPGVMPVETLTGNSGGAVGANGAGNINILGSTGINIVGNPGAFTLTVSNTFIYPYTAVNTTPYVVLAADYYLGVDCSGGPITIQLPDAPTTGRVIIIKDSTGNAHLNTITVTTVGGVVLIDGGASFGMNTQYEAVQVIFNGTSYEIF